MSAKRNENWRTVVAAISKGLITLSVLPVRQRFLPVFLIALLPALLVVVTGVIPQCYQSRDIGQRTVVLERKLASPSRLPAAHPIGFEDAWRRVVAKFPRWHPHQAEHPWLSGLVDLGIAYRLSTLKLESTGPRRLPGMLAKQGSTPASIVGFTAPMLTQQGFVWQVRGSVMDVLTVLDVLTAVAIQIDELSVDWLSDAVNSNLAQSTSSASVRVDLKFRLYVHEPNRHMHDSGSALGPNFDFTKPAHSGRWRSIDALTSDGHLHSMTCQPSTSFGLIATDASGIFLKDDVQDIRLVGVIETATDSGQSRMRGVFRNGQGAFGIAALDALLSMQSYRLVLLDRQRAVLQPTQPEGEETIDQASLVLSSRPSSYGAEEGVVLKPSSRRVR